MFFFTLALMGTGCYRNFTTSPAIPVTYNSGYDAPKRGYCHQYGDLHHDSHLHFHLYLYHDQNLYPDRDLVHPEHDHYAHRHEYVTV